MGKKELTVIIILLFFCLNFSLLLFNPKTLLIGELNSLLFFIALFMNVYYLYSARQNNKYLPIRLTTLQLIVINIIFLLISKLIDMYVVLEFDSTILDDLVNQELQIMESELQSMKAANSTPYEDIEQLVLARFSLLNVIKSIVWTIPFISISLLFLVSSFARSKNRE